MIVTKGTFTKAMGAALVALLVIPGAIAAQQQCGARAAVHAIVARTHSEDRIRNASLSRAGELANRGGLAPDPSDAVASLRVGG